MRHRKHTRTPAAGHGRSTSALVVVAVLLVHVSGAAADEPRRAGAPAGELQACAETPRDVGLQEETGLGVTAAQVLAEIEGTFTNQLEWRDTSDLVAIHSRAGSRTRLTLELRYDGGDIVFVDSTGGGCPDNPRIGAPCRVCHPRLEIDVVFQLRTDDGSLAGERFGATVVTQGRGGRVRAELPLADVVGTYLSDLTAKPGRAPRALVLEAAFGASVPGAQKTLPDTWNGYVAVLLDGEAGMPVNAGHGYWPAK